MNFISIICVGIGGALGAMSRYSLSVFMPTEKFPWATFVVNVIGCVVIGLLASVGTKIEGNWMLMLKTGFCGGFTTFSTFSLEALRLFQAGDWIMGTVYILVSIICCLAGVWIGMRV